ncbi:MAG: hypothetical protein KAH35_03550, partial [Candidatus Atribacteria bacterium]|nr:hypothetical protein [Candidatus Atribacteria bacterium]
AEYIISADELGDTVGSIKEKFEEPVSVVSPEVSSLDLKEIQSLIEDALDKKLEPILREIKRSQEHKISPTEIIGGIGYIVGIFGIVAYFLSCKK